MRDLHSDIKIVPVILAAAVSGNTTGKVVDLKGFESCEFAICVGTASAGFDGSNKFAFAVVEGDAVDSEDTPTSITDSGAVAAADLLSAAPTLDAAADDEMVYRVGYRGNKRYVSLTITETGTAAAPLSAVAILGHPRNAPVAAQTV